MLEELGRLLTAAFLLNRQQAERWAELIIGGATGQAARELVLAYIRGRQVGYTVHGATLGASRVIPARVARRWRDAGLAWAVDVQQRVLRTFDERGDVTRAFVQSYANGITTQATWTGNDEMFKDLAVASTVEFKRWVRAWPREEHRDWHDDLTDVVIPVDDLFTLPGGPNAGSQVYGPRDWNRVGDPAEHMNCGHALAFETRPARSELDRVNTTVYDPRSQPRTR